MDAAQYNKRFLSDPVVHVAPEIMQWMLHPSLHAGVKGLVTDTCCLKTAKDVTTTGDRPAMDIDEPLLAVVRGEEATSLAIRPGGAQVCNAVANVCLVE